MNKTLPIPEGSVVYISGKMTGLHAYGFKYFFYWQLVLEREGFCVINPAEIDVVKLFDGWQYTEDQWEALIEEDCELIRTRCNAVFAMNNWQESKGARIEVACALENNIPVFYESDLTERG